MATAATEVAVQSGGAGKGEAAPRPYHWTAEVYHRAWDAGVFGHDAEVELVSGSVVDRFAEPAPHGYHWSADAFDRACDADVFGSDARLELIGGRIIDRMGQGPLHLSCRVRIGRRLRAALEPPYSVVEECPIRIASDGEPVADVAVLRGAEGDYDEHNPTPDDVVLLVEVAVSSAENDLGEKALLYAQAGIADYWVVLPERGQIVVHRTPSPDGYLSVTPLGADDPLSSLAATGVNLSLRSLLGLSPRSMTR